VKPALKTLGLSRFCKPKQPYRAVRHLPLHGQWVTCAREGVELERSTLADGVGQMAALLTLLSEAIAS